MPLTDFQRGVAHLIAANRKPESHVAGGAVLNRDAGLHISDDLDIFHDLLTVGQNVPETVGACAEADEHLLREAGYSVEWAARGHVYKAIVSKGNERVRLDWTTDSAFRFFPALKDEDFGYCLHMADLTTNKVLALVGRTEIRDYLDILQLDRTYLTLGALIWAACGKDQGMTPDYIVDMMNRHSRYQEGDLKNAHLVREVDLKALKQQWNRAREEALKLFRRLPEDEIGCLYLDRNNKPVTPDPTSSDFPELIRHRGSVGGAWPARS
jgi:hypothetical protein